MLFETIELRVNRKYQSKQASTKKTLAF